MVNIVFEVDELVIAYIMQSRGIKNFGVSREKWNKLLKGVYERKSELPVRQICVELKEEYAAAQKLKVIIQRMWRQHENNVLAWLKELTNVDFRLPLVKVYVVPFTAGQTPFRDIPLIVVGKIREGWGYPETLAHELAHILLNQNFRFKDDVEHPYVQLIEEEIAVRLGARSKHFDYDIPLFAEWVRKAQLMKENWRRYLKHLNNYKNISKFIEENEGTNWNLE